MTMLKKIWSTITSIIGPRELHYLVGLLMIGGALWPLGWQYSVGTCGAILVYMGIWWRG